MSDALLWGIKSSLIAYVRSQHDGTVETTGGAEAVASGGFRFPLADGDEQTLRYRGGVRLRAHGGMMDIAVSDPWVELSGTPSISVLAAWTGEPAERLTIAWMDVATAEGGGWTGSPVRLTADGSLTLGALQYPEGQQVDDVTFSADLTQDQPA